MIAASSRRSSLGGVIGALARLGLVEALAPTPGRWPWATFIANVAGALALGYFTTRLQERLPLSAYRRPFLGTGLCGALTTFSTMQLELLRDARPRHAALGRRLRRGERGRRASLAVALATEPRASGGLAA